MASTLEEVIEREFKRGATPAGASLGAAIEKEFGEAAVPSTSKVIQSETLGTPGLSEIGARFSVGEGRTFQEKYNAFKKAFPEGELIYSHVSSPGVVTPGEREVSSGRQLLFRRTPNEPFAKVDPTLTEKFEPLADMAQFLSQDIGSIVGQVAATLPAGKTLSVLPFMARSFMGATVGDLAQQGVQEARGINTESAGDAAGGSVMKGFSAAAGAGAGNVVSKVLNAGRGAGFLSLERGAPEAIEAARRLGVPGPIAPQIALNPALKRAAGQAAAASSSIKQYVDEQGQAAVRAMDRLKATGQGDFPALLNQAERSERARILSLAQLPRRTEYTEAGRRIQQAVEQWDDIAKTQINGLYDTARRIDQPIFDFRAVQAEAERVAMGTQTRGLGGEVQILGPRGEVMSSVRQEGDLIKASKLPKESKLNDVIDTIRQVDPNVRELTLPDGKVVPAHEQLNAIRRQLYDLKTPPAGEVAKLEHREAARLYDAITKTIENPVNQNPAFVQAWKAANTAAARRFDTLDKIAVTQAIKSETPSRLADRITAPNNAENLATFRRLRQPDEYQSLVDAWKTRLLDRPENITKTLDSYDRPTLNLLLDKNEQSLFRNIGNQIDRLSATGIREALQKQSERGALAGQMFRTGDTAQLSELASFIARNGGSNSPFGRSVRAGIIDDIFDQVIRYDKGGRVIDFKRLDTVLSEYEKAGVNRFLTASDIQHLKDQRVVAEMMKRVNDAGTSIAGAEAAGDVVYRTSEKALYHMFRLMGFGRLMTMAPVNRFLIGSGEAKSPHVLLKMMSGAMGSTLADLERKE